MARLSEAYVCFANLTRSIVEHAVPTEQAARADPSTARRHARDDDLASHALSTTSLSLPGTLGVILARVTDSGHTLELRWIAELAASGQEEQTSPMPTVRLFFADAIVPSVILTALEGDDHTGLELHVLSEQGSLHTLTFNTLETLFFELQSGGASNSQPTWSREYLSHCLASEQTGRMPVLCHAVQGSDQIIVSCDDATLWLLERQDDGWTETELKPASTGSSFRMRSLLPSLSARSIVSLSPSDMPTFTLAMTSQRGNGLLGSLFTVTRDKKLRIYSLSTNQCVTVLALPESSSTATTSRALIRPVAQSRDSKIALWPATTRVLIKSAAANASEGDYSHYLVCYIPGPHNGFFVVYGCTVRAQDGELDTLVPLAYRDANMPEGARLVDFLPVYSQPILAGAEEEKKWTLWTLWSDAGMRSFRSCSLFDEDEQEMEEVGFTSLRANRTTWTDVLGSHRSRRSAATFESLLIDTPLSVAELFTEYIFYPGRFALSSIHFALSRIGHEGDRGLYESPLEHALAEVGAKVFLDHDPQTGLPMYEEYQTLLKREWLQFYSLVNQAETSGETPLALLYDETTSTLASLSRDGLALPFETDVFALAQLPPAQLESTQQISPAATKCLGSDDRLPELRQDILEIIQTLGAARSALSGIDVSELEQDLVALARTPRSFSVDQIVSDFYARHILDRPAVDEALADCAVSAFAHHEAIKLLLEAAAHLEVGLQLSEDRLPGTLFQTWFGAAAAHQIVHGRFQFVCLLFVLLAKYQHALDVQEEDLSMAEDDRPQPSDLQRLASLQLSALRSLRYLSLFRFLASQPAPLTAISSQDSETDLQKRMTHLNVTLANPDEEGSTSGSMLHYLFTHVAQLRIEPALAPARALSQGVLSSLALLFAPTQDSATINGVSVALLASFLVKCDCAEIALRLLDGFAKDAAIAYVAASANLQLGHAKAALDDFEAAASGIGQDEELSGVLPTDLPLDLPHYLQHVMDVMQQAGSTQGTLSIASRLVETLEPSEPELVDTTLSSGAWLSLFRSALALTKYDRAYSAIMAMPHRDLQQDCLRLFVTAIVDEGDVDLLIGYSFGQLQAAVSEFLDFRARNSDPRGTPNHYQVLSVWHLARGDYRSAGQVMYQQARRMAESAARSHAHSFADEAARQCEAYLAAINLLSLVPKSQAWISLRVESSASAGLRKRRRIQYFSPSSESSSDLDVIELGDIRKEYIVLLARLQLHVAYPELIHTVNVEGSSIVALFSQSRLFDQALAHAEQLGVDMSNVFAHLALQCVMLSEAETNHDPVESAWVDLDDAAVTWEGSHGLRAWRLLELHLERHDSNGRYRQVVLDKILSEDADARIPSWLIAYFVARDPAHLIRAYLRHNVVRAPLQLALAHIRKINEDAVHPTRQFANAVISYNAVEELLSVDSDDEDIKTLQDALRTALEQRCRMILKKDESMQTQAAELIGPAGQYWLDDSSQPMGEALLMMLPPSSTRMPPAPQKSLHAL
ncbi:uncharacterized protein L969DRAFT_94605 [Mixia osmundae IAM 14324]|uniref:Nuclear pore complex protein Nup160 n=1 Tax=Mixia osmundae (strain CBS 9802 / IAM 14324 / JCM 22182 / KY 12970) TaxID=764103 RepID=G7DVJ8_MIXOS|nr:uncharacterized protein L969DRAFT_94605 [Mixia osmundae IAM 14324]KEI39551.1 hypothetical protein L969DRAFT_94605 [Mixia osmundae IAM 14324]GAA94608.1 hypothetical protein E5Q_01260 [Mixia osmundae IAM 14324]